jgi:elongation factor Ts
MVVKIASLAAKADGDVAKLLAMTYPGKKTTVEDHVKEMIATIGENMSVRRTATLKVSKGVIGSYMHNQAAPELGKIGVMVALESTGKNADELANLGRLLAMHVAATNPVALDLDSVPPETLEREKAILADKNKGKPPQVLEKIVTSGLKSYAKENCLLDQAFVHDPGKSVTQVLKEAEGKVGGPVKITGFVRYALGEGIEKKDDDFAAEVAAAAGG